MTCQFIQQLDERQRCQRSQEITAVSAKFSKFKVNMKKHVENMMGGILRFLIQAVLEHDLFVEPSWVMCMYLQLGVAGSDIQVDSC